MVGQGGLLVDELAWDGGPQHSGLFAFVELPLSRSTVAIGSIQGECELKSAVTSGPLPGVGNELAN